MADSKLDGKEKLRQAEMAVTQARKAVAQQAAKLAKARAQVKLMRAKALESGTKAAQAALVKARELVRQETSALGQLRARVRTLVAEQKIARLLAAKELAEIRVRNRLEKVQQTIATRREKDLRAALEKFQARWARRRDAADQRKLKSSQMRADRSVKLTEKKLQAALKTLGKQGLLPAVDADSEIQTKPRGRKPAVRGAVKPAGRSTGRRSKAPSSGRSGAEVDTSGKDSA